MPRSQASACERDCNINDKRGRLPAALSQKMKPSNKEAGASGTGAFPSWSLGTREEAAASGIGAFPSWSLKTREIGRGCHL